MTLKELIETNRNDMQWKLMSRSGKTDLLTNLLKERSMKNRLTDATYVAAMELFLPMDIESWRILAGENSYRIEVRLKNVED